MFGFFGPLSSPVCWEVCLLRCRSPKAWSQSSTCLQLNSGFEGFQCTQEAPMGYAPLALQVRHVKRCRNIINVGNEEKGSKRWLNYVLIGISDNHTKEKPCSEHHSHVTQVWGASLGTAMSAFSPSLGSTVMLIPGSLSFMNGRLPVFRSSSRIRRTFLAQTFPWMMFLSSCVQLQ